MKLTSILKEIRVRSGRTLFPQDLKDIDIVFEFFGEGNSSFDLYNPLFESRDKYNYGEDSGPNGEWEPYEEDNDDPAYKAFKRLLEKPKGIYTGPDIFGVDRCPGAPGNALYTCLEIDPTNEYFGEPRPSLFLSSPYISNGGIEYVGWFDSSGKYYADTTHFDEDGNRIG